MRIKERNPTGSNRASRQTGLSLVELMIALLLSSLIILGALTMYLDSSETSNVGRSLARVQEGGRIALDLIKRDLRMAGFAGCADPLQDLAPSFVASTLNPDYYGTSLVGAIVDSDGWDDAVAEIAIAGMDANAVVGTDLLQVRRAAGPFATLDSDMASPASTISTDSDDTVTNFRSGENALITNCVIADVFAVGDPGAVADNELDHGTPLSGTYPEGSRVFHFNTSSYWVANTGRDDTRGRDIFALFQDGMEVVSGVERLQVLYGVREGGGATRFQGAGALDAGDWRDVHALRLGVLVSDEQSVMEVDDTKSYELPGLIVQPEGTADADATYPDDRRLRNTFTVTVQLRNQIE